MQGESRIDRELLDAAALVGHLVPEGSVFAFLAEHRLRVFPDGLFADLFPSSRGRPSLPGDLVACVLVLQNLQGLSDREAVEALRCDLRWKAACGLALTDEGIHPSVLTYWRRRLAASERPNRIFEAVGEVIAATGVLKGKTRRALDSAVLDDAVATQDTVTQLIAAIRRVGRQVPGAAEVIAARCSAHDYTDPGKPAIAWDDAAAKQRLVSGLVNDALAVVAAFEQAAAQGRLDEPAAQAVALLALVAGQDVEPADGSDGTDGRWKIARKVAADRLISTVDPDTRHVHKSVHHRQDGYKAHVAIEPDTGLFTGARLTKAAGPDNHEAVVGVELIENEDRDPAEQNQAGQNQAGQNQAGQNQAGQNQAGQNQAGQNQAGQNQAGQNQAGQNQAGQNQAEQNQAEQNQAGQKLEVLGDSAYGTGDARAALIEAGHKPIIKPGPLRPAVEGGFTLDDFTIDEHAATATCPNNITRKITPSRAVTFGAACRTCPLRERCTTSKSGRSLQLHPHDALLRQARRDWANHPDLQATYRQHRPMVERSIAWLIGPHGRARKLRHRGTAANNLWLHLRIAGLNLRRILNLGLTHTPQGWALA